MFRFLGTVGFLLLAILWVHITPVAAAPHPDLITCNPGYVAYPPTEECLPEDDPRLIPAAFTVTSWVCPANIVDREEWSTRCTRAFGNLALMHNRSPNYVATTFGSNVITMTNLAAGFFSLTPSWADTTTHPVLMTDCNDSLTGFAYRTRLASGDPMQMTLQSGSNWICSFYLMPTNADSALTDIRDPDATIALPDSLTARLQIAVSFCDYPEDDVRYAYEHCNDDSLSISESTFEVVDNLGISRTKTEFGPALYEFAGLLPGSVTITPSYPDDGRPVVAGTLFSCVNAASDDQGSTVSMIPIGESFTLDAVRGSAFMCDAYVVPDEPLVLDDAITMSVEFTTWHCDSPVDDLDTAREACPAAERNDADDTSVTLRATTSTGYSAIATADAGSMANLDHVPPWASFQLVFADRSDVGSVFASCLDTALPGVAAAGFEVLPGDSFGLAADGQSAMSCDFFVSPTDDPEDEDNSNISSGLPNDDPDPAEDEDLGSLTITLAGCPHEFTENGITDVEDGLAECDLTAPQTLAELTNADNDVVTTFLLGAVDPTSVTEGDLPIGTYELHISSPTAGGFEGTVFCGSEASAEDNEPFAILSGVETTCNIFIILPGEDESMAPAAEAGSIDVAVTACPGGVSALDFDDHGDAVATCDQPTQLTTVSILDVENDIIDTIPIGGSEAGSRNVDDVPAGAYTLEVTILPDYGSVTVICEANGTKWTDSSLEVFAGNTTTCAVILTLAENEDPAQIPSEDETEDMAPGGNDASASISVSVHACPPEYLLSEFDPLDSAVANCTDASPTRDIAIASLDRDWVTSGYSEDPAATEMTFTDIENGTYRIAVKPSAGFAKVILFCLSPSMFELQHGEGEVVVEILPGETMSCHAFMMQIAADDNASESIELVGRERKVSSVPEKHLEAKSKPRSVYSTTHGSAVT